MIRKYSKWIFTCSLLTLLFPIMSFAQEQETGIGGLKVKPTQIESSTEPGKTISGELILENHLNDNIEFSVYAQDIISTLDGTTYGLLNEGDSHSVARWITYKEKSYLVGKNSQLKIPYTIAIPYGVKTGSYWGITFLEVKGKESQKEKNVTIGSRVGIKMLIKVQPIKKIEISNINIKQNIFKYKEVGIDLKIKNIGSLAIQPKGSVKISENGDADNLEFRTDLINPGDEKVVHLTYNPRKFFNKYSIVATIDETNNKSEAVDFMMYPYLIGGIAVLVLFIIIIITFTIYRIRKKK